MRLRADRYTGTFSTSHLAANLVAIFLINTLKVLIEGGDVRKVNCRCRIFNRGCCSARGVRCKCTHEQLMGTIGATQASKVKCGCIGKEMCDESVCCGGRALCVGEVNQHRGVIDVICRAEVAHAIRPKH